jgi:hypothetical protein
MALQEAPRARRRESQNPRTSAALLAKCRDFSRGIEAALQ